MILSKIDNQLFWYNLKKSLLSNLLPIISFPIDINDGYEIVFNQKVLK